MRRCWKVCRRFRQARRWADSSFPCYSIRTKLVVPVEEAKTNVDWQRFDAFQQTRQLRCRATKLLHKRARAREVAALLNIENRRRQLEHSLTRSCFIDPKPVRIVVDAKRALLKQVVE